MNETTIVTSRWLRGLLAVAACAAITCTAIPAAADDFSGLAALPKVDDASLATMRGRYVPPGSGPAVPLSSNQGGQVTYFGVQMVSGWSVPGGPGTQGVEVGMTIGIDAVKHTITISSWNSSENGGLPTLNDGGNSVSGLPPVHDVNGIGQSIQVAGDDNTVSNSSTLVLSTLAPSFSIVPTTTTCGSVCTTTIGSNAVSISINTATGVVSQQIGKGGITQTVQLAGSDNSIWNTLKMDAQIQAPTGFNAGNLLPVLHTIDWMH